MARREHADGRAGRQALGSGNWRTERNEDEMGEPGHIGIYLKREAREALEYLRGRWDTNRNQAIVRALVEVAERERAIEAATSGRQKAA